MESDYYDKIDPNEVIRKLELLINNIKREKINTQLNAKQEVKMVTKLPEFKGYTVDERLEQFRKVDKEKSKIDFIDFDSEEGKKLLDQYEESKEE